MPLRNLIGIDHLKYSRRLSRLATDMAAECSFEATARRMLEHHSVEVSVSAIRQLTLTAAERATALLEKRGCVAEGQLSQQLVMEMDGVMVPVVDYKNSGDRRKTKSLRWQEMKVGVVQDPIRLQALYACSFEGANTLGDRLEILTFQMGGKNLPPLHGVGDGAGWIKEQGDRIGGCQYKHLIDFYHFSEYLHAAFEGNERQCLMVCRCKKEAKTGRLAKVVRRLRRELKRNSGHDGVIACLRYIRNRPGEFAYDQAIEKDLPIGSGLIESTNRSLIQKRLKLPGAWWLPKNAGKLANLRSLRANGRWNEFWLRAA